MARDPVRVKGGPQLERAFGKMRRDLADVRPAHRDAAQVVADLAEQLAPRRSGDLADSIRVEDVDGGAQVVAGDDHSVPYAGPIHYGWRDRNIDPQPFLTDALELAGDDVRAEYDRHVGEVVKRFDRAAP